MKAVRFAPMTRIARSAVTDVGRRVPSEPPVPGEAG